MDILKTATEWAKAEIFSSSFFILFGILFLAASIGFWQLGKTEIAKAYIFPTLIAGTLLLIIGIGLIYANKVRLNEFTAAHNNNAQAFIESEIVRTNNTLKEYKTIVFKAIPLIIIVAAFVIIFINTPLWRAISITTIAMLIVILLIDGTAHSRIAIYKEKLMQAEYQE